MTFRDSLYARDKTLVGTMLKTPAHELVEILAGSGLDYIAIDAEHAPFDRSRLDACLAIGRALDANLLVRVCDASRSEILKVLDSGAVGVIIPHVDSPEKARKVSAWSRFGHGGRGYAGSTRWAGFATRSMSDVLAQSTSETVVIAQIEEPEGVDAVDDIAAVEGIDALFVGPADLAVCLGETSMSAPAVLDAMAKVAEAAQANGKRCMTFVPGTDQIAALEEIGVTGFFVGSEHQFIYEGARKIARFR